MKYIATREGVEVLTGKGPATEKQKEMVSKLLKDFPDMRDSFEYEDYKQAPTLHTASALISAALDTHMQNLQSENGYLKYIATRPGAEKHGAHGLFGREDNANLTAAMHDLTAHDGNVWTIIYSLHREDAERLGYNNAAAWRKLLVSQQNKFAEAFHVPASALHWYAAYHDADTHPHIHMMIWTDQETVLKRDAVVKLRSAMTNSIFQAELENLYIRKDAAYKDVTEAAREVMRELVDRMESVSDPPATIQQKLLELAQELRTVGGKKQYGYLKKPLKDMVDSIVDELEKLPEVAAYGTMAERKLQFHPGEYRRDTCTIGKTKTTPPKNIGSQMSALISEYESLDKVELAQILDFHVRFGRIHPFTDGNGRIGRLLMFKECLRHEITPFILDDKRRTEYLKGIREWDMDKTTLFTPCLEAQARFQAQIDLQKLQEYAQRYKPADYKED